MSLINQMLRDLEHRRITEAGPSPLGGLSASGSATQSINLSINYTILAIAVVAIFAAGLIVAYLLGSQGQVLVGKDALADVAEKEISMVVETVAAPVAAPMVAQKKTRLNDMPAVVQAKTSDKEKVTVTAKVVAVAESAAEKEIGEVVSETLIVKQAKPVAIQQVGENTIDGAVIDAEEDINKTIRPLTDEQQAQLAFQRAVKLLGRGNQQSAQLALIDALSFSATHAQARETLAALFLNSGRVSEAASSLREGLQLTPGATPLAKLYARILVDQGDVGTAVSVLERARPAVSADPEYHALLAALYRQVEKYAQAARTYQQILMQRPGVASWWMGLALSQDAMGEKAQALDAFQRAQRAGGLSAQVLKYVQSRIAALTPVAPVVVSNSLDIDELED